MMTSSSCSRTSSLQQDRRDLRRRARRAPRRQACRTGASSPRLLRAQWHANQESALAWRIKQARMPEQWTLEILPLQAPAGRQPAADPHLRRAGVRPQGREHRLHRSDRRRQDRAWPPACCSRRCRTAIAALFIRAQDSSTRCTPRSPIARRASCSTAWRASTSLSSTRWATSTSNPSRRTSSSS